MLLCVCSNSHTPFNKSSLILVRCGLFGCMVMVWSNSNHVCRLNCARTIEYVVLVLEAMEHNMKTTMIVGSWIPCSTS